MFIFRSHQRNRRGRRQILRMEALEPRAVLAAGLIPLDLTVPINRTENGFTVIGTADVSATVVVLDPSDPSQLSITRATTIGSGTLSGLFFGSLITGTFQVDGNVPTYKFTFEPPNLLGIEVTATGTLDLLVDGEFSIDGTFTSTVQGKIDSVTGQFNGTLRLDAEADGFEETLNIPVQLSDVIDGLSVPNAALASIADRVFVDINHNGLKDLVEGGVGGVEISLINGHTNQVLESTRSDDDGFYSFVNLPSDLYILKVDFVPDGFDLGKQRVGTNEAIDSDVDSRGGRTEPISLIGAAHLRTIDIALRQVTFEWQNPNFSADVTGDGVVSALDALRVINAIGTIGTPFNLSSNRPIDAEFLDVTGDGICSALDALQVINALAQIQLSNLR